MVFREVILCDMIEFNMMLYDMTGCNVISLTSHSPDHKNGRHDSRLLLLVCHERAGTLLHRMSMPDLPEIF